MIHSIDFRNEKVKGGATRSPDEDETLSKRGKQDVGRERVLVCDDGNERGKGGGRRAACERKSKDRGKTRTSGDFDFQNDLEFTKRRKKLDDETDDDKPGEKKRTRKSPADYTPPLYFNRFLNSPGRWAAGVANPPSTSLSSLARPEAKFKPLNLASRLVSTLLARVMGSMSTTLSTALPSTTFRIFSTSQVFVEEPVPANASQNAEPMRETMD